MCWSRLLAWTLCMTLAFLSSRPQESPNPGGLNSAHAWSVFPSRGNCERQGLQCRCLQRGNRAPEFLVHILTFLIPCPSDWLSWSDPSFKREGPALVLKAHHQMGVGAASDSKRTSKVTISTYLLNDTPTQEGNHWTRCGLKFCVIPLSYAHIPWEKQWRLLNWNVLDWLFFSQSFTSEPPENFSKCTSLAPCLDLT